MHSRSIPTLFIASFLSPAFAFAQPAFAPPKEPIQQIHGALVVVGGGSISADIYDEFLRLAGGPQARLVIIPTASETADQKDEDYYLQSWKNRGAATVRLLHTRSKEKANDPAFVRLLADATAVWF